MASILYLLISLLGASSVLSIDLPTGSDAPFLEIVDDETFIIGNSIWNATLSGQYARPIYYNGKDLVDDATGFYLSYVDSDGFPWLDPEIVDAGDDWIDIQFTNDVARFHWVIFRDFAGAYQYWINTNLPGGVNDMRVIHRLSNETFHSGHTYRKDEQLPTWDLYYSGKEVQDSTVELSNGTYISKYDWATQINVPEAKFWGVYGDDVGSWFIQPSHEYVNGDQLKQELMVHMEAQTGDIAQLNMFGGGHYQFDINRTYGKGHMWGPWLWYLNDGTLSDVEERSEQEIAAWPYEFPNADISAAYQSRAGSVTGRITTSDNRVGDTVSVFLGDNSDALSTLDQYTGYYYRTSTDEDGYFTFENVRTGKYGLYAWPGEGSSVGDITTNFTQWDIEVTEQEGELDLGVYTWETQNRTKIWQIGTLDRLPCEFSGGCGPYEHGLTDDAPANLTFNIGSSSTEDWHYVLSNDGQWVINFELEGEPDENAGARLTVALASYAARCYIDITVNNDVQIGQIQGLESDSALYRSSPVAGVWRFLEYTIEPGIIKQGSNSIEFTTTATEQWKGAMWDTILLEWD